MPHTVVGAAAGALLISTLGLVHNFPQSKLSVTSAHAQSPSVSVRTAPTGAQHTTMQFRPDRTENAATGTPNGWGQVMWPTTMTAWAWMPPPVRGGQIAHTTDGEKRGVGGSPPTRTGYNSRPRDRKSPGSWEK